MNHSGFMLAAALAVLQAACFDADSDVDALDIAPLPSEPLNDPTGSTGQNGLSSDDFHAYKMAISEAADMPVLDGSGHLNAVTTGIFGTAHGANTFKYAMRCALPVGTSVFYGTKEFPGYGMLNTTTAWLSTPLGAGAKADLFACMGTHLNPLGVEVPIRLTGLAVTNQASDASEFTFQEAVWVASIDPSGAVRFDVWPLPDLAGACGPLTSASLELRICGQSPADCGLNLRDDLGAACTRVKGGILCDGKRAIRSWLRTDDVPLLHPGCQVP